MSQKSEPRAAPGRGRAAARPAGGGSRSGASCLQAGPGSQLTLGPVTPLLPYLQRAEHSTAFKKKKKTTFFF